MAYYSKNGTGIDANAYIYVQLQVTRTDYDTYSHFDLKSVAVSNTGSSGFIKGQVTTNQGGTAWTAATGWKDVYYNGTTVLATSSFNVNRGTSDATVRCGAYAQGGGSGIYAGGEDYAWLNVTVPKVESPNAPSGCSASYVSDSSASVTWTNGSTTTARPRTATLIERQTDSGSWVQVASVGSSVSNWTDNGISGNHSYLYRVRAQNSAGYSAYSTVASEVRTTPAAPSGIILDKTAATTVQLDVSGSWPYAATFDVQSTYDNGATWADEESGASIPVSITVNAGTVQFRVRAVMGDLRSDWTLSSSLVTITPPLAPTITSRPSGNVPNGSTVTIGWTPNHPDGSAQESAQVKVTDPNGTPTTYTVNATSWTSSALTVNGTYTAQVRTKGLDPDWGAWSDSVSWGVYNPPSVAIQTPSVDGSTIDQLPYSITWQVTDPTGVSAQRIIVSDGSELLNVQPSPDSRSFSMTASNVNLENGGSYTITLRVMGGSGLITTQTRTFNVSWIPPAEPSVSIENGEGAVSVQVSFGGGTPATESVDLFRINPDGTSWLIASDMADGDAAQDPLPPLGVGYTYKAVASAQSGATASTEASNSIGGCRWALNFGQAASVCRLVGRNPSYNVGYTHGGELYHFARGFQNPEDMLPEFYPVGSVDASGTLEFDAESRADADEIMALMFRYPVAWLRTPFGERRRVRLSPNYNLDRRTKRLSVSFDLIRFGEAW